MIFREGLFSGKVALVTGGGSGIGLEIARQFLQLGAEVFIASRKAQRLEEAMAVLQPLGMVHSYQVDIREPDQVAGLAEFIADRSGQLDVLVNNAGGQFPSRAEDISPKGWQAVINTNLNGTWYVTQTMAQRFFFEQKAGIVVNIVVNHYRGFPGMAHTGAARAGVSNLTQSLAVEWAQRGIRLNCVAPGIIRSSGLEQYPPELVASIAQHVPMKRLGSTDEVAALVLFLASPAATYISGETIYVDGGAHLWGDVWQYSE
ncbi:MAG: SDR family oxidoreductase [Saprospiraceae bacterium]|nr:SDR family oxidoreductase [Saprospiraceae bacterium]MDW8230253.1 SDR family oxidoreductase [Saprospiraceae bacterium]